MNILITAGASALAQDLAETLCQKHTVCLTDMVDVPTQLPFVRCDLGHDEATNQLVAGVDVLIHLAASHSEYAERPSDNSEISANRLIDYQTRCTYILLHAASEAGVSRCIYASSLSLFAGVFDEVGCDDDWAVNEQWRPRPTTQPSILAQHLGEFVCREFARERRIAITCLRLGDLGQSGDNAEQPSDPTWLARQDAVHAFECALAAPAQPWAVYHIQSAFPGARFSSGKARDAIGFALRQGSSGSES